MIEPKHPKITIEVKCRLLPVARSSFNYEPQDESTINFALMLLIDKQFWEKKRYGVLQMT